jgi:hypothetical protein
MTPIVADNEDITAIVQQQAETFNSGVMREHREAMGFADVLELLHYSHAREEPRGE